MRRDPDQPSDSERAKRLVIARIVANDPAQSATTRAFWTAKVAEIEAGEPRIARLADAIEARPR